MQLIYELSYIAESASVRLAGLVILSGSLLQIFLRPVSVCLKLYFLREVSGRKIGVGNWSVHFFLNDSFLAASLNETHAVAFYICEAI